MSCVNMLSIFTESDTAAIDNEFDTVDPLQLISAQPTPQKSKSSNLIVNKPGRPRHSNTKLCFQPTSKVATALRLERKKRVLKREERKRKLSKEQLHYITHESCFDSNESEEFCSYESINSVKSEETMNVTFEIEKNGIDEAIDEAITETPKIFKNNGKVNVQNNVNAVDEIITEKPKISENGEKAIVENHGSEKKSLQNKNENSINLSHIDFKNCIINKEIADKPKSTHNNKEAIVDNNVSGDKHLQQEKKDFICDKCDFSSITASGFSKHYHSHLGALPYNCSFNDCNFSTQHYNKLYYHKKKVHSNEAKIKCDIESCGFSTNFRTVLRIHYVKKHNGEKTIACGLCSYRCYLTSELKKHMITHSSATPFSCDFPGCGYSCKLSTNLRKHRRSHTEERPYACDQCVFRSNFISSLKAHKRTHTNERPFCCDQCGHTCNSASNLKKHILHRHRDNKVIEAVKV